MSTTKEIVWIERDWEVKVDGDIEVIDYQFVIWAEHEGGVVAKIEGIYILDRKISTIEIVWVWYSVECIKGE